MKRMMILLMLLFTFLTGCNQKTNYETDGPFIIVTSSPAGPDEYRNFFKRNLIIDDDGKLLLYIKSEEELKIGNDAPVYETQLGKEDIKQLKQLIEENNFWEFKEDLTNPDTMDGSFLYITVNLMDQSKKVGGLNPDDPKFIEITDYVYSLVSDKDYNAWEEEIKEHIYQMNPE